MDGCSVRLRDLFPDAQVSRSGKEAHTSCWRCGGTTRLIIFEHDGRDYAWCRQCSWKGDAIQLLRDRDGLSFAEAKRRLGMDDTHQARGEIERQRRHRHALAAARAAYEKWARHKLVELTDEYRALLGERDIASAAYRLVCRRPELFSQDEAEQVVIGLGAIYDKLASLENTLDVLTYDRFELERARWWKEEEGNGGTRIAA